MKSKTKSIITLEQVRYIAGLHFPEADVNSITELTDGAYNTAYLVERDDTLNNGVVLKIGPEKSTEILTYEKNIIHTEVEVYKLLNKKPIPTPKVLGYDFSRRNIPCDYFFMEKISGDTWKSIKRKISKANRKTLMKELGKYNAVVHSVKGSWFGYIKEDMRFRFDSWAEAFSTMMTDILDDGQNRGYNLHYDEINRILTECCTVLDEIKTPRLVDFDMWAGNVFLKKENDFQISGIIDFERCFYGDPFADFTSAMMIFNDVEKERSFQEGYCEISGAPLIISDHDRLRMTLYRLYMALIMLVETYRYSKTYAAIVRKYCNSLINKYINELKKQLN